MRISFVGRGAAVHSKESPRHSGCVSHDNDPTGKKHLQWGDYFSRGFRCGQRQADGKPAEISLSQSIQSLI